AGAPRRHRRTHAGVAERVRDCRRFFGARFDKEEKMRSILQDLHYALRQLRKSPGFTVSAVAVLALGLGANIAVFTVLNGIFLKPLPYARPDRLVTVELPNNDERFFDFEMRYSN